MGFSAIQVVSLKCLVRVFFVRNFAMSKDKSLFDLLTQRTAREGPGEEKKYAGA
jgi:hypothetical protein